MYDLILQLLPGEGEADGVLERHVARLCHGLDHAAVGDAHLRQTDIVLFSDSSL